MTTLTHSQAHASGDLASPGATAGRIARLNESRAIAASERGLFDGALKAISSFTMTPERVAKLISVINDAVEFDSRYAIGHGHYEIRLALLECKCRIDSEVNPEDEDPSIEDLAELAGRVA